MKGTSGLPIKVLACNGKVAGSSPTRYRLFLPMSIPSLTLKKEEVFIIASFGGDVNLSLLESWLISFVLIPQINPIGQTTFTFMG